MSWEGADSHGKWTSGQVETCGLAPGWQAWRLCSATATAAVASCTASTGLAWLSGPRTPCTTLPLAHERVFAATVILQLMRLGQAGG